MLIIAICDEDKSMRNQLADLVRQIEPDCFIKEYGTGEALLKEEAPSDIVLMDVNLSGINGVEVAKELRRRTPKKHGVRAPLLIFITALDQYVFEAFDIGVFHYLLKPIDEKKFREVLIQAVEEYRAIQDEKLIFINTRNVHRVLDLHEIYYIESNRRKVIICTNTESIETYATMEEIQRLLGGLFFRCHRGYFVNLEMIQGYDRNTIHLKNGTEILLAKQKYNDFVRTYTNFLKEGGILSV